MRDLGRKRLRLPSTKLGGAITARLRILSRLLNFHPARHQKSPSAETTGSSHKQLTNTPNLVEIIVERIEPVEGGRAAIRASDPSFRTKRRLREATATGGDPPG